VRAFEAVVQLESPAPKKLVVEAVVNVPAVAKRAVEVAFVEVELVETRFGRVLVAVVVAVNDPAMAELPSEETPSTESANVGVVLPIPTPVALTVSVGVDP
jgi:hypothetical protein